MSHVADPQQSIAVDDFFRVSVRTLILWQI